MLKVGVWSSGGLGESHKEAKEVALSDSALVLRAREHVSDSVNKFIILL